MRFGPFLGLSLILIFLWGSAFLMFHVAGTILHLVLLLAVISLIAHFFAVKLTGKRAASRNS